MANVHKLDCAEVWGGISEGDATIASPGMYASLFSSSGKGRKGGDIYFLSLCNSAYVTRVAIADVTGHGDAVSDMSTSLYDLLGRHVDNHNGNEVLVDLNREAFRKGVGAVTTAVVVTYYRGDRSFSYAYAGHPPLLLKRRNEADWSRLQIGADRETGGTNIPLAVAEDARYIQDSVILDKGDRVLLYTDGLPDSTSAKGEPFGMARLLDTLKAHGDEDLENLRDAIIRALCTHTGGELVHDDVTLLLLEIR